MALNVHALCLPTPPCCMYTQHFAGSAFLMLITAAETTYYGYVFAHTRLLHDCPCECQEPALGTSSRTCRSQAGLLVHACRFWKAFEQFPHGRVGSSFSQS